MPKAHRPFRISTKRGLERLYDGLYLAGQRLFDKYDPCKIRPTEKTNKKGRQLMLCAKYDRPSLARLCCCEECDYLGKKGCRVKALGCKLWLCWSGKKKCPELTRRLIILNRIGDAHGLIGFREPKVRSIRRAL